METGVSPWVLIFFHLIGLELIAITLFSIINRVSIASMQAALMYNSLKEVLPGENPMNQLVAILAAQKLGANTAAGAAVNAVSAVAQTAAQAAKLKGHRAHQ